MTEWDMALTTGRVFYCRMSLPERSLPIARATRKWRCGRKKLVPQERVCLNSPEEVEALFQALQDFEDQLRPHRYELEELGL